MMSFTVSVRSLEILLFLCFACAVIAGTFSLVFNRRYNLPNMNLWCGPSHEDFSVDITKHAVPSGDGYIWTDTGMHFPAGTFWVNDSKHIFGCPCSVRHCVRKCCQSGVEFDETRECITASNSSKVQDYVRDMFASDVNSYFVLQKDLPCAQPLILDDTEHPLLLRDGRLFMSRVNDPYLNQGQYCVDSFNDTLSYLECQEETARSAITWLDNVKVYAMMVSVPFLLITFLVYAITPSLRNLHGKLLMCNIFCLALSYLSNSIIQLQWIDRTSAGCEVVALVLQFSFLGIFFWLNVMSFDIWLIFSDLSSSCNPKAAGTKLIERRKFLLYSVYAWGGPALITAVVMFMDLSPLVPDHYVKPQFGVVTCWHYGNEARVLYSYLPSGVLLGLNCLMFMSTAYRLWCHTSKAKRLSTGCGSQRFSLYGKLFIVMGLNWVMELASFMMEGNDYIWFLSDLGNTLQGLLIFYLFIYKKSVLKQLRDRYCPKSISEKYLPRNGGSVWSQNTRSSNVCGSRPASTCVRVNADVPLTCL